MMRAQQTGRDAITGADVLIELFGEPVGHFLQEQGVTELDAKRYLSHGIGAGAHTAPGSAEADASRPGSGELVDVQLLNDNYTPMEFVVEVLERVFGMEHDDAERLMLHIHRTGIGKCGRYPYDIAQAKVTEVLGLAREHQHPLECVIRRDASA